MNVKHVMKTGLIGCGAISEVYLRCSRQFSSFQIVKCADLKPELAAKRASEFQLEALTVDELFADPELELILNLTPPQMHVPLNLRALEAGKHVYSEKVFATDLDDARKVFEKAKECGRYAVSAPDSFLGASQQYARELVDKGELGHIFGGTASIMNAVGYHSDHPNIGFFFRKGGGPLFDMGPYYLSALVNILGPVKRVGALGGRPGETRCCTAGLCAGKEFPVEVNTHIQSLIEFHSGAVISFNSSFDTWGNSNPRVELYGEKGSLRLPEPSSFGSVVTLRRRENPEWVEENAPYEYGQITRGLGVADLAEAIQSGRSPRCSSDFIYHILEVMCAIDASCSEKNFLEISSTCVRPDPMPRKKI